MTRLDFSPLSGDPTLSQTEQEWCEDMAGQLENLRNTGSLAYVARLWEEMTDDERDLMRTYAVTWEGRPA